MHVTAEPLLVELPVGEPGTIAVSITNTSSMIDAYDVDAFGLDPAWTTVTPRRLSLFPAEVGIVEVAIALPPDVPAGSRAIAIHVRSENDRNEFSLAQVNLDVGLRSRTTMRVDPTVVTGGNRAEFALILANEGNSSVEARPVGEDPEDILDIRCEPGIVLLAPGRREVVRAEATGGRPWFGQPKPRIITFTHGPGSAPMMATFVQRPRIGRWLLSLLGLVTAAAIFAVVLSTVADRLVEESSVDPALLDRALTQASDGGGGMVSVQPIVMTGKVVVTSTGAGIAGVTLDLYRSTNGTVPVKSAATDDSGTFAFSRVPEGRYRIKISGGGFAEQWYQGAATFADATDIDVPASGVVPPLEDITIGGRPGSLQGKVITEDPTGTTARLVVQGVVDSATNALVAETTVSADGTFQFEDIPSPADYQLIVSKEGFATETRDVHLDAAQDLEGIEIVLREGDGSAAGTVQSPSGPLGGVEIVATSGDLEISTVSLTVDDVGGFTLRNLPTPGTYTVTFARDGYAPATRTIDLQAAQQVTGLAVTMTPTTASISGRVSDVNGPLGGVTVTVSGPDDVDFTTTSASIGDVGAYAFQGLPSPATYTLTFSKAGYVSQSLLKELGVGGQGAVTGADTTMVSATAIVGGVVLDSEGNPLPGATVELSDGAVTRQVLAATNLPGRFQFTTVQPGAYTLTARSLGTSDAVRLVNVVAADVVDLTITLQPQASLYGQVLRVDATGQTVPYAGATVRLFDATSFPGTPAQAIAVRQTDAAGNYTFTAVQAPADFVVAVYAADTSSDPLDSVLVQSQPSFAAQVPTFTIRTAG